MSDLRRKALFLCTGNSCRSQMAEGLLRNMADNRFQAVSAGVDPESEISPYAVKAMAEIGLDISRQLPKGIDHFLKKEDIHYLIVVCENAQQSCPRLWPGLRAENRFYWPIADPAKIRGSDEEILKGYRRVRDELKEKIEIWLVDC